MARGPLLEFGVCSFHGQALREGAPWTENGGELVLDGRDRLIDWSVTQTLGRPTVKLTIGDGFGGRDIEFTADLAELGNLGEILMRFADAEPFD